MPKLSVCIEILCPKPIAFCTHLTQSYPVPGSVSVSSDKVESWSNCATGPDGISPRVLKTCSSALAHPLSVLLTVSFAQGHLPSAYKSANITTLHKKVQKQFPSTTDQSAFSQSSARLWNPSSLQTLNPSSSPMA